MEHGRICHGRGNESGGAHLKEDGSTTLEGVLGKVRTYKWCTSKIGS